MGGGRPPEFIVATGGVSYPLTGSTGDGYRLAQSVGHTVTEVRGSLVPLCAARGALPPASGAEPPERDAAGL